MSAGQTREAIEKLGVRIVNSDDLILYFSLSGKTISYDLSNREYAWSLVIFNGVDPPRESDIVFDPDLVKYFEKRP
jgi:hypothetical protein